MSGFMPNPRRRGKLAAGTCIAAFRIEAGIFFNRWTQGCFSIAMQSCKPMKEAFDVPFIHSGAR